MLFINALIISFSVFAQKQADNWYFGNYSAVSFTSGSPAALTNSAMVAWGGCASISDSSGNLICYTNGSTVYDKKHNIMSNGANLMGDFQYGNYGPSVIMVPRPGSNTTYYIFSINRNNTATGYPDALRYSTVITTLNNGDGGVINRNYILSQKTFDAKITAVKHVNGVDYWVIVHEFNTNKFYSFLVSNAGVSTTPVISSTGRTVIFPYTYYWWSGYMKASPDGKKIASTYNHYYQYNPNDSAHCEVYNFNNSTGVLSNPVELTISRWGYYYFWGAKSIEFSPDGSKLYLGDHANYWPSSIFEVYQFDLNAGNATAIQKSRTKIGGAAGNWWWYYSGAMQLANDGKIYVTRYYSNYLGVINAPNQKGIGCCYQDSGVYLTSGRYSYNGLPNFITSWFFKHPFDFKNVCFGDTAKFVIQNKSCLDSVLWNFGDTSSGSKNYSKTLEGKHLFSKAGKFTVSLTTYIMGTETTAKREIEVYPLPNKKLWINDTFQCLNGNYFKFIDSTTITGDSIVQRIWKLEDKLNLLGNKTDTSVVFNSCDTFQLKLTLKTSKGCYDSVLKNLWVNPEPKAGFKANDSVQCFNGHLFEFTNQTSIQYGNVNYYWHFGDTNTSYTKNTQHEYQQFDTFIIQMKATSEAGCIDSVTKNIYLHPSPNARFSTNDSTQCLRGNKFTFTDSSTIYKDVLSYNWYFGDNSYFYRKDTSHIYTSDDTFSVKLVVESSLGCKDSVTHQAIVYPQPKAGFSINDSAQCLKMNNFVFNNSSSINTGSMSFLWNFGDNSSSGNINPNHSYINHDTFDVKLVASSAFSCKDSITRKLILFPMPSSDFNINDTTQCFNEHLLNFTNNTTIASGHLQYFWNFGDGNTSNLENITNYRYLNFGNYNVRLVSQSDNNCFDTLFKKAFIYPSPLSLFTISDSLQCQKWNKSTFTNQSSLASGTFNSLWNFGDGNTSGLFSPQHKYSFADTFKVALIVNSDKNCSDTSSKINIVLPSPEIIVGINDTSQCFEGNNFIFYNNSKIKWGSMSYRWYFGDGDSSNVLSPAHSYANADTFDVVMIALSDLGCSDSILLSTIVHVHPMPVAFFSIDDSAQCLNSNLFNFKNYSSVSAGSMTYSWHFGDNSNSTLINPSHQYLNFDTFEVKLIAVSNWDCRDSIIRQSIVFPVPEIDFSVNDSAQCLSANSFQFNNLTGIFSGSVASWFWDMDDGTSFYSKNINYSFTLADTFNVSLKATSALNCSDSISKKIIVFPMPAAAFSSDTASLCLTDNVFHFTNKSSISKGNTSSYFWNMGDSAEYYTQNTTHSYLKPDKYTVKLKVISDLQCADSVYSQIIVYPMPLADFTLNDSSQCFNEQLFIANDKSEVKGDIISKLLWSINTDTILNSKTISIKNLNPGTSILRLTAFTSHNCSDTSNRLLTVNPSPVSSFSVNDTHQCLIGNNFIFTNKSSILYGTMSYFWDLGDGNSSVNIHPSNSYSDDTVYYVRLITESDLNCKDSIQFPVTVHPMPKADFSFSQACLDQQMNFTDLSVINKPDIINKWMWDFGDGTANNQNPQFTFIIPGNKTAKLTVTSNFDCADDTFMAFNIHPHPIAPYLLNVSVDDDKDLMIRWEKPQSGTVLFYQLEKSTDGNKFFPLAKFNFKVTDYLDKNLNVKNKAYTYRINAVDSCNFVSPYSNTGRNIVLHANDSDIFPIIYWTAYEHWPEGVAEYRLEVFDEPTQSYENIGSFSNIRMFTDESTLKNQNFLCYRVQAQHSTRPDVISISNSDCIPTTLYAFVPNAFTPNNDGLNETFTITGKNIVEFTMFIYDRWGKEIYFSDDINKGWDGKYKGQLCPAGSYYFYVKARGSNGQFKVVKGGLSLIW